MALAIGPTSSVAVVACLLATVGFGGWRRATLPAPPAEKVPLYQPIDVADRPDLVPSVTANKDAQVKQLPQHVTRPRIRLQDGSLWTPQRAAFFRKSGQHCFKPTASKDAQVKQLPQHGTPLRMRLQDGRLCTRKKTACFRKTGRQCFKPTAELLPSPAQRHMSQPVQEQEVAHDKGDAAKDVAGATAIGQEEFQESNSLRKLVAGSLALAWIIDLLLVLPVCFGCWLCLRRRHISIEEIQQASKAAKAGEVADEDTAKSMLRSVPSPSRQRMHSQVSATDKVVEAASGCEDEATPRSQEASVSRGEPEPESSLELLGTNSAMEPFDEAEPEQKAPFEEAEPEQRAAVIRRNSCDLAEVMRQRREVCNTWESAPDGSTADTGAIESEAGGVTPAGSGAASTLEFPVTSSPKVRRLSVDLAEVMRQRRHVCTEFESAPLDSTADTTALQQEVAVLGPSPQQAPHQHHEACTATRAGELVMTPPATQPQNGEELRSTSEDVARRQMQN
mmetsp:Transcript_23401/g.44887  ORF Transcript_23401/g.44887 Transcript_23401/m.44887 type:complete len:506 (+) Transcript_23401:37-1554(+)